MRGVWLLAATLVLLAAQASAQSTSGSTSGPGSASPAKSGHAPATSHAQVAERLAGRGGAQGADRPPLADPKVAAAAKSAEQAALDDPTVRPMVDGSMSKPPSLAGGAPDLPAPSTAPPR